MEANKNLFWNKAMFWGFVIALASMLVTTVYYSTDNMASKSQSWIDWGIFVVGIIVCGMVYRQSLTEKEEFPYSKALGLGVATALFASLILAVFTFVLHKYIDPNLISEILSSTEDQLLDSGLDEDMIEKQIEISAKLMTPALLSIYAIFGTVIKGLIISLITSIAIRKKSIDGFEAAMNEIDDED
ncbi:MAG: DUF4199 domain-containing protein [Prolixibacteraceae bacterium]